MAETNFDAVAGTLNSKPTLLWENSNKTSAFNAQQINVDMQKYKAIIIMFCYASTGFPLYSSLFPLANLPISAELSYCTNASRCRSVTINSLTSISFGDGYFYSSYNPNADMKTAAAKECTPMYIYGIM